MLTYRRIFVNRNKTFITTNVLIRGTSYPVVEKVTNCGSRNLKNLRTMYSNELLVDNLLSNHFLPGVRC